MPSPTSPAFTWDKNQWTSLNEMADGFGEYRPPLSQGLAGRTIELHCSTVGFDAAAFVLTHDFADHALRWRMSGETGYEEGEASYELFEMQPGLYFLHYRREEADHPVVVTMALDLSSGSATGAIGELGLEPTPHCARQQWFHGTLNPEGRHAPSHHLTDELIGHRIRYAYSSDDVYDHLYLNRNLFTWLCVGGAEAGLGDTDSCVYWKLREKTYLFSWLEKNVGVEGMVLIDLNAMRTVGIQFGLDQHSGDVVNITMGAYAEQLDHAPGVDEVCPGPTRER